MTYFAPFIDNSGLNIPTYQDIEDHLMQKAKEIFGNDIYLGSDSQDYQDIAARAQTIYDSLLAAQLAYNSRSPVSATGAGLDSIVAINGIRRKVSTYSSVTVTLTGTPFTLISNGKISDVSGNQWLLPESVTIGSGSTVTVTATSAVKGAITALTGDVKFIQTPTAGWSSVSNPAPATPGQPVEEDSVLKARQAVSVANPSQALTEGILGAVLAVPNVLSAQLYENDSGNDLNSINGVGNPDKFPPHSITLVVDGGDIAEIASAIAIRKTPGCYLNGDQSYVIYDQFSVPTTVRFYLPSEVTIELTLTIKALNGYNSAIGEAAVQNVVDYINGLVAGQNVILSELSAAAAAANTTPKKPYFSITNIEAAISGDPLAEDDLILTFKQKAVISTDDITLVVA